ncbi:MAG: hypothetical protein J7L17_00755 [Thaumarchaeota archaeon]|nr:hypothetical protein [Nitrososphaerota archaeon]
MGLASRSRLPAQLAIIAIILGFLSVGIAQQVKVVTTTTVITIPGTTKVVTVTKPGTTGAATVVQGGYKLVYVEMRPDQECVVAVEGEPKTVVTIPGVSFPGVTTVFTIPKTVYETTLTRIEGGTTETRTGVEYLTLATTATMGPATTVIAIPMPVYGIIKEHCEQITVVVVNRFEASEPMTQTIAIPGFTQEGTVITIPAMPFTMALTATKTVTKPGTTYTTTIENPGTTVITTVSAPGTTMLTTMTYPPRTITKTLTYTTTLGETKSTTKTTGSGVTTAASPTSAMPTTRVSGRTGFDIFSMLTVVIVAAVVAAAIAAMVALITKKARGL